MGHVCHANNCYKPVAPSKLMCLTHWNMVPKEIQKKVLDNFNPKQCSGKVRPSLEWLKAAREALNHVAKLEGNYETTTNKPTQEG